ncbi:MAG TPA: SMP-30/gluconolactonase/LRE family protein [Candidatus Binatia bacterium]|nr:SMP-30/gluconolactonase/LRE family protein [Candidatus Binatia bacterium]
MPRFRFRPSHSFMGVVLVVIAAHAASAQTCYDVATFAGRGVGDGGPGAQAVLIAPRNVVVDGAGNIIIADSGNSRVRRFDAASGTVTTIVGNGALGSPTDGVPAVQSELNLPSGVALDTAGNLYIADEENDVVLQMTPDGVLHRFAGSGIRSGSIDGNPNGGSDATDNLNDGFDAKIATFSHPLRVAVDAGGNVFVSDSGNQRVRMIDKATNKISTVAGNGTAAPGTPGPATSSGFIRPVGLAIGAAGELYIADNGSAPQVAPPVPGAGHQVWKLAAGALTLVAGDAATGAPGAAPPPGGPPVAAVGAPLNSPGDLALDANGQLYIGDTGNNVVRRVANGMIQTVVGDGTYDFREGPAIVARFRHPGVALTPDATALIIPDTDNNRVRRYDFAADNTSTIVGGPNDPGDGGPATAAFLQRPTGLAVDAGGNVFVSEHDSHRVRMIDANQIITTVVNSQGLNGPPQPGQPAIAQSLQQPTGLGFAGGNLLIVDAVANQVYLVDSGGHGNLGFFAGNGGLCPIATTGPPDPCGDGGPAPQATLNTALRVATASDGSVFIADFGDHRIRRVDPTGIITTVAGRGFAGSGGDGGPANQARLNNPAALVFDGAGNLFIADFGNDKIRKIDTTGTISTIAGTGSPGALGDGGVAGAAELNKPTGLGFTSDGALVFADQGNNEIRRIAPDANGAISSTSTITTIVGNGTAGFKDGPGPTANLLAPTEVMALADGRLLIADRGNQRVRVATPGGSCVGAGPEGPASCATDGCIPGGGKNDCLLETLVKGVHSQGAKVTCRDGDASCDFDTTRGRCTFAVALCFNEPGCSASGVTKLVVNGAAAGTLLQGVSTLASANHAGNTVSFPQPFTTASSCTDLMSISVPLKKNGRKKGTMKLAMKAFGSGRTKDKDTIRLVCVP